MPNPPIQPPNVRQTTFMLLMMLVPGCIADHPLGARVTGLEIRIAGTPEDVMTHAIRISMGNKQITSTISLTELKAAIGPEAIVEERVSQLLARLCEVQA